ncbi:hypothetical protein SAMN05421666_2419 [Roseovarius nanhaiticus]|uniref:Uncharacterized protein n=2 Tax=Roseovarius nanhaiticus TaxID=573024 RepID=A0A1N7H300_9RHOB|nr:hypothetical protein SAMN05216208_2900 [Roseovarius nanhaiticus]SIS19211.1 hypothetical protein SAMN05421666_2419 [Roseovarius nanhaiticus]
MSRGAGAANLALMSKAAETDLYPPVKAWLSAQGYDVKGEVGAADVVAQKGAEMLIVELKLGFSLVLLQQAVARQSLCDAVYVAVPRWRGKAGWKAFKGNIALCKRLGVGVLSVDGEGAVQTHCDPGPFQPRKSPKKRGRLVREFAARAGDPTRGGTNGQVMTSYRQDALACAAHLAGSGPCKGAEVARATGVGRATTIMAADHHGWFVRVARGVYGVTEAGALAAQGNEPDAPTAG